MSDLRRAPTRTKTLHVFPPRWDIQRRSRPHGMPKRRDVPHTRDVRKQELKPAPVSWPFRIRELLLCHFCTVFRLFFLTFGIYSPKLRKELVTPVMKPLPGAGHGINEAAERGTRFYI